MINDSKMDFYLVASSRVLLTVRSARYGDPFWHKFKLRWCDGQSKYLSPLTFLVYSSLLCEVCQGLAESRGFSPSTSVGLLSNRGEVLSPSQLVLISVCQQGNETFCE